MPVVIEAERIKMPLSHVQLRTREQMLGIVDTGGTQRVAPPRRSNQKIRRASSDGDVI